ncbi:defender against death DAD protein [Dacryopinax primogenitus]|uniref:Dolichyl-diphosphooligosaccharide--protein glycosyltransferase subunit OST2 n=1 Tax=Dacryopinax primogenitus (strain DJM 731) TaxID=1858805 RepID=M5FQ92_DACPD|nr:defender against death DAD protein [Dacryopinax primogenitus]EJT97588.1 defender against death DAD protein [Dacryopinax primogenitus]
MAGPKKTVTASSQSPVSAITSAGQDLVKSYVDNTPKRVKIIDTFLLFIMLSGVAQFVYCALVTNFPFNAFLAGFGSTIGQFVLTAAFRAQVNPSTRSEFTIISPERAFADFCIGSIILHFFVYNFLG